MKKLHLRCVTGGRIPLCIGTGDEEDQGRLENILQNCQKIFLYSDVIFCTMGKNEIGCSGVAAKWFPNSRCSETWSDFSDVE